MQSAAAVALMPLMTFCRVHRNWTHNAFQLARQLTKIVPSSSRLVYPFLQNERTNEVYLPMNRVNSDRLPVKAEAHQSWPPKKRQSNNTKTTEKKKKEKYIVIHKITPEKKYKKN